MAQATLEALNRPRSRFRLPSFRSDYRNTPLLAFMAIESEGGNREDPLRSIRLRPVLEVLRRRLLLGKRHLPLALPALALEELLAIRKSRSFDWSARRPPHHRLRGCNLHYR